MRTYNITKNLNTNAGRNKYSIPIGTTRNIRGSANRIFQYCNQNSDDPFYCMFGIVKPSPPIKPCLNGYVSYSYTYIGEGTISEAVVKQNLPVYSIADVLNVNPEITIIGNTVYVEITTCLYDLPSYPDNVGISLNSNPDIVEFIEENTNGIIFTGSSNCPFAKNGSQFKGVSNLTITQAKGIKIMKGTKRFREITYFTPYFLPGTSLSGCFQNCTNFNSNISGWDTTNVTNMSNMFYQATNFNQNIGNWNTSNITDMSSMFYGATLFNQNINSWNTSNVTNMDFLFRGAINFNQPLNSWNTSNVTTMSYMFNTATYFNQNINSWNTSNVTNMSYMFYEATYFNQNIGLWDVSKVITMQSMFYKATSFNNGESPDIQNWKAHSCINFNSTFSGASKFNQPLTNLVDTTNVVSCDMFQMFYNAILFNQPLNSWNTSNVTNMQATFNIATSFNQPLNNWNTSNVTNMTNMFRQATSFNENISSWYAPKCTSFSSMFNGASRFNQPLPNLVDASGVDCSLNSMFQFDASFNQNIGNWNVINVTTMASMFNEAYTFNNGGSDSIKNWYAPKCTSFNGMFRASGIIFYHRFNQPLPILVDTSGVSSCTLDNMFIYDLSFNQNVGGWNVSNVTSMNNIFNSAYTFNNGNSDSIKNWYAPKCTSFSGMFLGYNNTNLTHRFNQPLPFLVDTSGVTSCTINSMFQNDTSFNQDIGNWNVSNVTNMASTFQSASQFNNDALNSIQSWRAPKCINFSSMFNGASRFNQPLPNLVDTSGVSSCTLANMFQNDVSFNQNVGDWNVINVISMANMFQSASQFNNGGINSIQSWKAPKCTTFSNMFSGASRFNQPLPILVDTSGVSSCSLANMFLGDTSFNQNVGDWNVSNVTTMANMFQNASMFNNDASNSIQSWYAPKCTTFSAMFSGASRFNQPLPILVDTSGVDCSLSFMFQNDTSFNQNVGDWNVSNVTTMANMFQGASTFNNDASNSIQSWRAPKCTNFSSMFSGAYLFNQPLPDLVDASATTLSSMFFGSTTATLIMRFNNGQINLQNIPNSIPSTYNDSTGVITCTNTSSAFLTNLVIGDVLIIQTSSILFPTVVTNIISNTQFSVSPKFGTNISSGIISIDRQISGSAPLNWNTSNVTNMSNMFSYCRYFNQQISTNGNIWNTNKVTNASGAFQGLFVAKNTFNNGQIITGTTAPMGWVFDPSASLTNFRNFCVLTNTNKPSAVT
jgi:surface protein